MVVIARLLFLRRIRVINVKVLIKNMDSGVENKKIPAYLVKFSEYEELVKAIKLSEENSKKKILKLCP